jgi:transposase
LKCGFEANADYNAALNIACGGVKMPEEMVRENQENSDE